MLMILSGHGGEQVHQDISLSARQRASAYCQVIHKLFKILKTLVSCLGHHFGDMAPVEHVWHKLGRHIENRAQKPKTVVALRQSLTEMLPKECDAKHFVNPQLVLMPGMGIHNIDSYVCCKKMSKEPSRRMSLDAGTSFAKFTETFHYNDRHHGSDLLDNLRELWYKRLFCDITIATNDREIKAHRIILSTFSPYFSAMFSLDMKEGHCHNVDLPYLDGDILEKVFDFGYTGEIDIQGKDIFDILSTANFLGMDSLVRGCCVYLVVHMNKDNCLDILQVADSFGCRDLYEAAKLVALHRFIETCKSDRFLQLPPDLVFKLVKDENIVVEKQKLVASTCEQEVEIWHAIESYVDFDFPNRKQWLPKFLEHIRLPLINYHFLELIEQSVLIQDNDVCNELLKEAKLLANDICPGHKVAQWTVPRNFAEHLYYSTDEIACGGHLRPDQQRFTDFHLVEKDSGYVVGMDLFIRQWYGTKVLGGMRICYSNGQETFHGSDEYVDKYNFRLREEERITAVESTAGWMVDSLTFHTNFGQTLGPFGGHGGGKKVVSPKGAFPYLAAVSGVVVSSDRHFGITRLRFLYGHYQFPKPNALLLLRPDLLMPGTTEGHTVDQYVNCQEMQ